MRRGRDIIVCDACMTTEESHQLIEAMRTADDGKIVSLRNKLPHMDFWLYPPDEFQDGAGI